MFSKVKSMCFIALTLSSALLNAAELKFGMSTALSGGSQALGQAMKLGVETYFQEINAKGGVNGNTLSLIALDDQYEPTSAAPNMRKLIDENQVLAVLGNVGTPTATVSVPIANETKTLLYGAYTGAGVLRKNPPDRYVINFRASYAEETANMVEGVLKKGIKPEEIAFFTQNDSYGDAGYNGAIEALKKHGFNDIAKLAHGRYERNTMNVEDAVGKLLDAAVEPKAIIMVGTYGPCAKFIKLAKAEFPDAHFMNVSFVGSTALLNQLGQDADGVIIMQVVPNYNSELPVVKEYNAALQKYGKGVAADFVSLEGYIAAKIFVEGLKKINGTVTKEAIIDALENINNLDIGLGNLISFSKTNHQASHQVWPTIIKAGKFELLDWKNL